MEPLKRFSLEGVTYQQEIIRCGKKGCKACPHGPYWYAYYWQYGRTRQSYVGKKLPPGLVTPEQPPEAPPPPPPMTLAQARKILRCKLSDGFDVCRSRWQSLRQTHLKLVPPNRAGVVQLDLAWEVMFKASQW